jgi:tetratricopeptide (TPR) repeat protein
MDTEAYLAFAKQQAQDLAIRQDDQGKVPARGRRRQQWRGDAKQRMFLRGTHICYQGPEDEADQDMRGSDSTLRLTLIVTALEKYHEATNGKARGANYQACLAAAECLLSHARLPLRTLFLRGKRGRKPRLPEAPADQTRLSSPSQLPSGRDARLVELDAEILAEEKRHRLAPPEVVTRLANSIRNEVRQWRAANPDYQATFDMRFGGFLFSNWRDAEWYARAERVYQARIEWAEEYLHPSEGRKSDQPPRGITAEQWERMKSENMCTRKTDVAEACVNLAHLYHQQRKFDLARECYEKALGLYDAELALERHRKLVIPWIATQIAKCDNGQDSDPYPSLERPA